MQEVESGISDSCFPAFLMVLESLTDAAHRWYIVIIHSLPIESWVVEDDTIAERDRVPLGLSRSGSKLGPFRNRRSSVRIVTGATPRIHQLEQESRRCSL